MFKKFLTFIIYMALIARSPDASAFLTSHWIAWAGGVGTIWSGMLYKAAAEQEEESKANIEKVDKILKTFKDSFKDFCPDGRESLSQPKCYCYLEDGKQNPKRSSSQTCKDLWAKDSYKLAATAGEYGGVSKFVDPVGCVSVKGEFDEKCKCKKFVDTTGNNACMKNTNINIPVELGGGFATDTGLTRVAAFSNSAANGNPNFGLIDDGTYKKAAIASQKMKEEILRKLGDRLPANVLALSKMNEKNAAQYARAVMGDKAFNAAAAKGGSSAMGIAGSRDGDAKTNDLLKAAEKTAGLDLFNGSGKGLANKKSDGKEAFNFNFAGDSANPNANQAQNFPDTDKNYNFKDNDISKKSDVSIFEIISNRYIQSGLKRLFEE